MRERRGPVSESMTRHKFQFSNAQAQRAEALLNAREARTLLQPCIPAHLREQAPQATTTAAGECFRRVCGILAPKNRTSYDSHYGHRCEGNHALPAPAGKSGK